MMGYLMRYINVVDGILSNYIIVDDNLGAKKT
jgi:hypothetical protein